MPELTSEQQSILDAITAFRRDHPYPPTLGELAELTYFSYNALRKHIIELEKAGYVSHKPGAVRTLVVKQRVEVGAAD